MGKQSKERKRRIQAGLEEPRPKSLTAVQRDQIVGEVMGDLMFKMLLVNRSPKKEERWKGY